MRDLNNAEKLTSQPADSDQIAKARRISEIAEREKKATKGPWFFESRRDPQIEVLVTEAEESDDQYLCHAPVLLPGYELGSSQIDDNWEFIQEARADIPFLLSELASERQAVIEDCAKVLENGANQWDANAKTAARNGDSAGGMIGITVASALRKIVAAIRSME